MIKEELKAVVTNKKLLIPIIAVIFIPVLYSAMFLWAFWDPYEKLSELPVAVVNEDNGKIMNGERVMIGEDIVGKLKESEDFHWEFVSAAQAEKGMDERYYYMTVTIPETFTTNALTLDNPTQAQLEFTANESVNFLSAQIGETAIDRLKAAVSAEITKQYAEVMFDKVKIVADGLDEASEGASKIASGTNDVHDGVSEMNRHLDTLSSSTLQFSSGFTKAQQGYGELHNGLDNLEKGTAKLLEELKKSVPNVEALANGTTELQTHVNTLSKGLGELHGGSAQLATGQEKMVDGVETLATHLQSVEEGLEGATQASQQLATLVNQIAESKGNADPALYEQTVMLSKGLASSLEQVKAGQQQINEAHQQIVEKQKELLAGTQTLSENMKKATDGSQAIAAGMEEVQEGTKTLQTGWGAVIENVEKLHDGEQQLVKGSQSFEKGFSQLSAGANELATGANKLSTGSNQLVEGMNPLIDGTSELATKLEDAAQEAAKTEGNEQLYTQFAEPIVVDEKKGKEVPNYGTGFAPYFLSLGLFVGSLLISIVFPLREPPVNPKSARSWFYGKLVVLVLVGCIQAVIAVSILLYGLQLEVQSIGYFYLFSIMTSITFMGIIQCLVTLFKDPGRFIAIVILILQLTTSAGTFPLELIPNALQWFHHWLPMTYTVWGYKAIISSGDFAFMWQNIGILILFMFLMFVVTRYYFSLMYKRRFAGIE
ncbi:YhgE/Pip domain-containing protein [Alkalihalobacterium bogoriense]|uniref:YhgE/Pip domain-containing protein n=1 Tax=Alkalihalobacterium bogoriense TaxID=246272 RepID=UPI00047E30AF|nr:YhgE/Pip domain-containing protein [Alkalihalobacterium bogoriense]